MSDLEEFLELGITPPEETTGRWICGFCHKPIFGPVRWLGNSKGHPAHERCYEEHLRAAVDIWAGDRRSIWQIMMDGYERPRGVPRIG